MSAWMITATGKDHYLSGAEALLNAIDIYDIAWALAQTNRYTGHARRPYSVAEHSLLVADLAKHEGKSATVQLACLMHDAHEAYTGDGSSPVKVSVGLSWSKFEHLQADLVRRFFGLRTAFAAHRDLVHHYDMVALATERRDLIQFDATHNRAWVIDEPGREVPPASWVNLNAIDRLVRPWNAWRDLYLSEFFTLQGAIQAAARSLQAASPTH
jgi:hypothetical protein